MTAPHSTIPTPRTDALAATHDEAAEWVEKTAGYSELLEHARELEREAIRLDGLINTPRTDDFFAAVRLEAAHQQARWGAAHDQGKEPQDWFWLLGYLSGKALRSFITGDNEKGLHHTISSAAVLLNWHRHATGEMTAMRPGIAEPTT